MPKSAITDGTRLKLLNEFATLLLEADSEEEVSWVIAKQAIAHLGFEDCVIYLLDGPSGKLIQMAAHGNKNPAERDILNPITIPLGKGIVGSAALTLENQLVEDVRKDDRYILDDIARLSELAVPMMHHGECIGVVDSEHTEVGFFDQSHESILTTIAALGAARIVHIRVMSALKKSQSEFQQLVEHASDIVYRVNNRGIFTYVNPVAAQLTGYSEEELTGMHFLTLISENHRDEVLSYYLSQRKDDDRKTYREFSIKTKQGKIRWLGQNARVIVEDGVFVGFQAIARDITDLKAATEATGRSEATMRAMIDSALDAIIVIDENDIILQFNTAAEEIFGYSTAEAIGETLGSLIIPDDAVHDHQTAIDRFLKSGVSDVIGRRRELIAKHKDGRLFPIELSLTVTETGDGKHFIGFARDITSQKESQEALKEARRISDESAASKTTFLSNMSHEIRTPLNAVIGISHLLGKTTLTDKQERYVYDVQRAADSLLGLINNILDLQKFESGHVELENVVYSLTDLLEELVGRMKYSEGAENLTISLKGEAEIPVWVRGDPFRVTQILTNLLNNAIKFTSEGSVTLYVRLVERGRIEFKVVDTGIGISEESLSKIFDLFIQASSSTTRRFGGTGLGLPIVRQLVELMGGEIQVDSELGKGSRFRIRLPINPVSDQEALDTLVIPEITELSGVRILIVEDNPTNQFVAREILEAWKADVEVASGGREAIDILKSNIFDVVLMDLQMPDMDGYETTAYIRNELGLTSDKLPIIALTASALSAQKSRATQVGIDDYIVKPFDPKYLHSRICLAIETRNTADNKRPDDRLTNWQFFKDNYGQNQELLDKTIAIFSEQIPGTISGFDQAISESDLSAIRFLAHRLKPSVQLVGAASLQGLCSQIEHDVEQQNDAAVILKNAKTLRDLLPALREELEAPIKIGE